LPVFLCTRACIFTPPCLSVLHPLFACFVHHLACATALCLSFYAHCLSFSAP
jgi:hypothetical protein